MQSLPLFWLVIAIGGAVIVGKTAREKWYRHRAMEMADRACDLREREQKREAIADLEGFLKRAIGVPPLPLVPVWLALASLYQASERFEEAEALSHRALHLLPEQTHLERMARADFHYRLAYTLDAQGQLEAAHDMVRTGHSFALKGLKRHQYPLETNAWYAMKAAEYQKAADLYLQAASLKGAEWIPEAQALNVANAAKALHHGRRYQEGLDTARNALTLIQSMPNTSVQLFALSEAAQCARMVKDLTAAQAYTEQGLLLARKRGVPEEIGAFLLLMGWLHFYKGEMGQALRFVDGAESLAERLQVSAEELRYFIEQMRGNHVESLRWLDRAAESVEKSADDAQRQWHAYLRAEALMELGRGTEALLVLTNAERDTGEEGKRGGHAMRARAGAMQALPDAEAKLIEIALELEDMIGESNALHSGYQDELPQVARGLQAVGEYKASLHLWDKYFATSPYPVYLPAYWYFTGECHQALGNHAAARQAWQRAADSGLDTEHAINAQKRLQQ